jgi:hypothetical protein
MNAVRGSTETNSQIRNNRPDTRVDCIQTFFTAERQKGRECLCPECRRVILGVQKDRIATMLVRQFLAVMDTLQVSDLLL